VPTRFGSWPLTFEELTYFYVEEGAQLVDRFNVDARCSLLVQERDGVAMQPSLPRHVSDLELAFAHQAGQVALNHVALKEKSLSRTTKSLDE
jgi:hypothetical protein